MSLPVLVVDDDENVGKVFQMGFRQEGVHIVYFSRAPEALEWASEVKPALAIIDVMMPDMDGLELCQALRNRDNTRDLPIILLSGIDKTELKRMASLVGAVMYITKPFAPGQVFELMRLHLAQER